MQPARVESDSAVKRPDHGYWSTGRYRWFIAVKPELGTPYAKPYVSLGYGLPHWLWAGVDVNAIVTPEMAQAYAGIRAATPVLDVAFGVRDTLSFDKPFLLPSARFTRDDVLVDAGDRARYWAWEFEVTGVLPLPHAGVVANLVVVHTLDVPNDRFVYDESYRAVVADPTFVTLRIAAVARVLAEDSLRTGVLMEHVFETGRSKPVVRLGPVISLQLTDHLDATAGVTFAVASPDALGLVLGTFALAGVRWRWATGERAPKAPWQGHWIPW
jgi:hypothetical protein